MKKKWLLVIFMLFGIFLAGCSSSNVDGTKTSGFPSIGGGSNSKGGNGVILEFGEGMNNIQPQKDIPFTMVLNLKNYQRHSIDDLLIKITGFDTGYASNLDFERTETVSAASETAPSQKAIIYDGVTLGGFTGDYTWNPVFKYCYSTSTKFREQVCIPNQFGQSCENKIDSNIFSNGPMGVKIDSIYAQGANQVGVELTLSDNMGGDVVNECFEDKNRIPFGKLSNEGVRVNLGSEPGDCIPITSDDHTVVNDNIKYKCTFNRNGGEDPYTSQITVETDYKYQSEIKKNIVIRDLENR